VVTRSNVRPARRVITVSDAEGYSKRRDDEQRDLQNRMVEIQEQAARSAGLDLMQAFIQPTGDGNLIVWPQEISELDLIVHYLRELSYELERVNATLRRSSRIRLRFAVSVGLAESVGQGVNGQAAIRASLLANSDQLREALQNNPRRLLAVILDDRVFEDVVNTRRLGLRPEDYQQVDVSDKNGTKHTAWITLPGSGRRGLSTSSSGSAGNGASPAQTRQPEKSSSVRRRRMPIQVTVALISAAGLIVAAAVTAAANLGSSPGDTPTTHPDSGASASSSAPASPTVTVSEPAPSTSQPASKFHNEETDNHRGTSVFLDPMGDAPTSGPADIPFGTQVAVKCWARNESGMGSINAFYLVETPPWAGEYAPANTFLNADTTGTLDPLVPRCTAV
jgi:hypothetical protein